MADTVMKIIDVAIAIKGAIDTVRSNHKECKAIADVADQVCGLLRVLHTSAEPAVRHSAVAAVLGSILESMEKALQLVISCGDKNIVLQLIGAQSTAKKLSKVQRQILEKISLGTLAVTVATAVNQSRPQLPGGLDSPYPCTSLPELLGHLGGIYNGELSYTSYLVTDQTISTMGFAMKAGGARFMWLTATEGLGQELFAFGWHMDYHIMSATAVQLGVKDRHSTTTLCCPTWNPEFLLHSVRTDRENRQRAKRYGEQLRLAGLDIQQQPAEGLALLLGDLALDKPSIACHTKDEFDAQLAKGNEAGKLVVVYFSWSTNYWWHYLRFVSVFADYAKEYPTAALFLEVHKDELKDIATTYNIRDAPSFVLIRNNLTLKTLVGASPDKLRNTIKEFIHEDTPAAASPSSSV